MIFEEFTDNTDRYTEFIEELLDANAEGRFDEVFNRAYGMQTFTEEELIDIYAMVDSQCVSNFRSEDGSEKAKALNALRICLLRSLSKANTSSISFELAACFFDHFSKEASEMDRGAEIEESLTRIFKCIASTGSWAEFFAGLEPVFHTYYPEFSDRIHFDCARLSGISCNIERGRQIITSPDCNASFKNAVLERNV